jgi:hypothetical protein
MSTGLKLTCLLLAGALCLPVAGRADTTRTTHHVHKAKKELPPLPSGPQGPVEQVPLDSMAPVPPQVTYEHEQLTIIAPNSTLGDILRAVRKRTSAEIEIPSNATERVVTHLGPGPARDVMAELLNGSRFNYVLLGSPQDANLLTRVVLVAKTGPDTVPAAPQTPGANTNNEDAAADATPDAPEAQTADEAATTSDANASDQGTADADQNPPEQPGIKTPQQLLQEMQQRQLMMQQQQNGQPNQPGQYPPTGPIPQPTQPQNQ